MFQWHDFYNTYIHDSILNDYRVFRSDLQTAVIQLLINIILNRFLYLLPVQHVWNKIPWRNNNKKNHILMLPTVKEPTIDQDYTGC